MEKKVAVVGAGLVGSLLSVYLARRGYKIDVYERRGDLRTGNLAGGRSINLALSERGWNGLRGIGLEEEIRKISIPMSGRVIHHVNGEIDFQPYGKEGQAIYSVSRLGLNIRLMELADASENISFHFDERCVRADLEKGLLGFENQKTGLFSEVETDLIFGSDGAFSALRLSMQMTDRYDYSQTYLEHGYKELSIPTTADGNFAMHQNALHIWPRGGFMLIALPNLDKSFTCTLFFPFEGEKSFSKINTPENLLQFFNETFPDVVPLMPTLVEDFFNNPTGSLMTVRCFPWAYKDKVLLIGDAAHAIVPFFGQGMNCGFEDCTVLEELMNQNDKDLGEVFRKFELSRKPNSDAIAQLALDNFIEMRDLVGDKKFLLRKKIEAEINKKYPDQWLSQYSMVTFSNIPYSEALRRGENQRIIMDKVMQIPDIENKWNSEEVMNRIKTEMGN